MGGSAHEGEEVTEPEDEPVGRPESEEPQERARAFTPPPAATQHPGGEAGIAPPGQAPPLFPDTSESLVEEAEHGAAAEVEIDAATDALRTSNAEERAQRRAGGGGGAAAGADDHRGLSESGTPDPPSGAGGNPEDPTAADDRDLDDVGAEPAEVREIETDSSPSGSDPLVEHFPDE